MRTAIVHDWLTGMRGGEKVLEALCELFPDADLFTLLHIPGAVSGLIEKRRITTSFIQRLPLAKKRYRLYLPLFPLAVEGFDLKGYDLVISSSHCAAKGVIPGPNALHISYIHSPMRYVWDMYGEYFGKARGLSGLLIRLFAHYLRLWDSSSSCRVDFFVANSNHVSKRIMRYYRRDSSVIYPPVDVSRFSIAEQATADYYLIVSAFAPYKRLDIAVEAFNALGKRLLIAGTGQEEKRLKAMAGKNIEFLGWKSDTEVAKLYRNCRALVFPGEEDFGITPVEAMACGRPVIAYGKGGALETVRGLNAPEGRGNSPTGVFFYEQTAEALKDAVESFEANMRAFDPSSIRQSAMAFDKGVFKEKIGKFILDRCAEAGVR